MNKWEKMSNSEIRQRMESMTYEYESLKNKINKIISEMDYLDKEYNDAHNEIEKRLKK